MLWNGKYGSYYLGVENQLLENYPMLYHILNHDCLIYKDQIKNLKSSEDFLSGIKATDQKKKRRGVIAMCETLDRMREEYGTKRYLQSKAEGL